MSRVPFSLLYIYFFCVFLLDFLCSVCFSSFFGLFKKIKLTFSFSCQGFLFFYRVMCVNGLCNNQSRTCVEGFWVRGGLFPQRWILSFIGRPRLSAPSTKKPHTFVLMSSPRLGQVGTWEGHTPRDTLHDYSIKKKKRKKNTTFLQ